MYVLRRIFPDVDEPDFKAFGSLSDARALLKTTEPRTPGDIESAALFYVPGENDERKAVDLVRRGEPDRVVLLKLDFLTESLDVPALREIVDEVLRRPSLTRQPRRRRLTTPYTNKSQLTTEGVDNSN